MVSVNFILETNKAASKIGGDLLKLPQPLPPTTHNTQTRILMNYDYRLGRQGVEVEKVKK